MAVLKVPVSSEDHIRGNEKALVTLLEYGDFACPFCGLAYPIVKKVRDFFGDRLKFVYRHFPLKEIHPYSEAASEAAEYAADQGRFWEMYDLIYENQKQLNLPLLFKLADKLKLSSEGLKLALDKKNYQAKIQQDFMGGVRSGVSGTPTFYVNEQRHIGPFDYEDLVASIESALAK